MKLQSYLMGEWREGQGEGVPVRDASTGEVLARVTAEGLPVKEAVAWGREVGGKALLALGFQERGRRLRALAQYLSERKEALYRLYATTGGRGGTPGTTWTGGSGSFTPIAPSPATSPRATSSPRTTSFPSPRTSLSRGGTSSPPRGDHRPDQRLQLPRMGALGEVRPRLPRGGPHPGEARHPHGPRGRGPGADDAGVGPPPGREPPAPRGKRGGPL